MTVVVHGDRFLRVTDEFGNLKYILARFFNKLLKLFVCHTTNVNIETFQCKLLSPFPIFMLNQLHPEVVEIDVFN